MIESHKSGVPVIDPERTGRLIGEIYHVFHDVDRKGGVSWSESQVIDNYGSVGERVDARLGDLGQSWTELVASDWNAHPGIGGWAFLDAIGCRYYLPAAMIRGIHLGYSGLDFWLTLDSADIRHWSGSKWSMLDERQRDCVKHFIDYMIDISLDRQDDIGADSWREVLASGWGKIYGTPIAEPEALPPPPPPNPLKGA
jgi:hypothetical protein